MNKEQLEKKLDDMLNELNTKHKGYKMETSTIKITFKRDNTEEIDIQNCSTYHLALSIDSLYSNLKEHGFDKRDVTKLSHKHELFIEMAKYDWVKGDNKEGIISITFEDIEKEPTMKIATNVNMQEVAGWMVLEAIEELELNLKKYVSDDEFDKIMSNIGTKNKESFKKESGDADQIDELIEILKEFRANLGK